MQKIEYCTFVNKKKEEKKGRRKKKFDQDF